MAYIDMVRSHVERLLQDGVDKCRVDPDDDGDYRQDYGSAIVFLRVVDHDPGFVRIFSVVLRDVRYSAKLLRELNEINRRLVYGRFTHAGMLVVLKHYLIAGSLDQETLATACGALGETANDFGPTLAAVYGGTTARPFDLANTEAQ